MSDVLRRKSSPTILLRRMRDANRKQFTTLSLSLTVQDKYRKRSHRAYPPEDTYFSFSPSASLKGSFTQISELAHPRVISDLYEFLSSLWTQLEMFLRMLVTRQLMATATVKHSAKCLLSSSTEERAHTQVWSFECVS